MKNNYSSKEEELVLLRQLPTQRRIEYLEDRVLDIEKLILEILNVLNTNSN